MSVEFPSDPREALEASLTALALGELTPDQEAFVRQAMAQDPDLAGRFERLKQTIDMVRVVEADPTGSPLEPPVALRLSDERRQALLQTFRTVTPPQFARERRRKINWAIPAAMAALFVVVVGVALLPALSRSKS
ncbi:MAG: anti-sigma factor family protein, partial [Limisphaerales bacterium]